MKTHIIHIPLLASCLMSLENKSTPHTTEPRRFPRPLTVREHAEYFIVEDANSTALSYTYFIDEKALGTAAAGRLNKDDARRIATFIARAPNLVSAGK